MAVAAALALAGCGTTVGGGAASHPPATPLATPPATTPPATVPPATRAPAARPTSANWVTYDRTAARAGVSASSPPAGALRRSWSSTLDAAVYAQPLVVGGTVIAATEDGTVYALSASTGRVRWERHLATPVTGGLPCGDISPSGITGTPVADPATGRLWVVTFSSQPSDHHTLWTLDLATGRPLAHRRADVAGSDPSAEQQRSALSLLDGRVDIPYGGLAGDCSDYQGRVLGLPAGGTRPAVSFTTPNQREAGIWSPGGGVVDDGSLYATGNGTPADAVDDSDSVLRLSPTLTQEGRFTPRDFEQLSEDDTDLGSTSPAVLPGGLLFEAGKQGTGYLLDAAHLGGTGGALATVDLGTGAFGGDAVDGRTVVVSLFDGIDAVTVTPTPAGGRPSARVAWHVGGIRPGPPVIAGGVVWDLTRDGALVGYRPAGGARVAGASVGAVPTSFPSLSASGTRLFVPVGNRVESYLGA